MSVLRLQISLAIKQLKHVSIHVLIKQQEVLMISMLIFQQGYALRNVLRYQLYLREMILVDAWPNVQLTLMQIISRGTVLQFAL